MIVNHISTANLVKKNDICKFKCKMHTFFWGKRYPGIVESVISKQHDHKGRAALILHSIQGLLFLSLRTITS